MVPQLESGKPRSSGWLRERPAVTVAMALLVLAIALSYFGDWPWLPWAIGAGVAIVMRVIGLWKIFGQWSMAISLGLIVLLLGQDTSWWTWGITAGIVLIIFALLARPRFAKFDLQKPPIRIGVAVAGVVLLAIGSIGWGVKLSNQAEVDQQAEQSKSEQSRARLRPQSATGALGALITGVSRGDVTIGCGSLLFTDQGRKAFSDAHGGPSCADVISRLHSQVTDEIAYRNFPPGGITNSSQFFADGCTMHWGTPILDEKPVNPGPRLGMVHVQKQPAGGMLINDYQAC